MKSPFHTPAVSEGRFQNLVRQFPIGIAVLSLPGYRVEEANEFYCDFVLCQLEEIRGRSIFDILPADQRPTRQLLDEVRRTGTPFSLYEYPHFSPAGGKRKPRYLTLTYQPYREADGAITGVMMLVQDVTEQVVARRAAEDSEQRFRNLVEEATVPTSVFCGPDMRIRYVNEAMLHIIGRDRSIVGKTLREALPELERQPFFELLDRVYTTGETYLGKEDRADMMVNGKLQTLYINHSYKALRDREGAIYGILNMAVDVTERVMARKQVEESEKTLRNTILRAPVALCIFRGPSFVVEIANHRMVELWGRQAAEVLHRPVFSAIPEAWSRDYEALLAGVLATGKPFNADELPVILVREGAPQTVFINVACEPLYDSDGAVSGIMAVASEVTDLVVTRKKIEELVGKRTRELEEANKNLQRSNAELEEFAYITSHDLQEPLRKLTIFAHMLESNLAEKEPQAREYIEKIVNASLRMRHLIRDVLAYSLLSQQAPAFESVGLAELLLQLKTEFEGFLRQQEATLEAAPLPRVEAIRFQMQQLFSHLLGNALKFTRKGEKPRIFITVEPFGDEEARVHALPPGLRYFHLVFRDNGIGFDPRDAELIFDIFRRLHDPKEYGGTGIGLALCKKIVRNHQGAIWAEAEKGKGAAFHVVLPERQP
ncbi:PAS domain-containing protein [Paraflavisolibacter sp. H34]|uniref:PAS domain-containing sensor histidine kinase n=1 Tax=Huijunlia imazamoxiresistens TaxID=3127457 RepID=UPI0030171219